MVDNFPYEIALLIHNHQPNPNSSLQTRVESGCWDTIWKDCLGDRMFWSFMMNLLCNSVVLWLYFAYIYIYICLIFIFCGTMTLQHALTVCSVMRSVSLYKWLSYGGQTHWGCVIGWVLGGPALTPLPGWPCSPSCAWAPSIPNSKRSLQTWQTKLAGCRNWRHNLTIAVRCWDDSSFICDLSNFFFKGNLSQNTAIQAEHMMEHCRIKGTTQGVDDRLLPSKTSLLDTLEMSNLADQ